MKTLIICGSPRRNGDSAYLTELLVQRLKGDVSVWNCCFKRVAYCTDCRLCRKNSGCVIKDDWQELFALIKASDNIVISSPIWFSQLSAPLLGTMSRIQCVYSAVRFQDTELISGSKNGGIILTGGGNGSFKPAENTAICLLHQMNCRNIFRTVLSVKTDEISAKDDNSADEEISALAVFLNGAGNIQTV